MILVIDVKKENILLNENGRIVIKLDYYSAFSTAAWLCTLDGRTLEDYEKRKATKHQKNLEIGNRGGISVSF